MAKLSGISVLFFCVTALMYARKNKEPYKFIEDINAKVEIDTVPWKYQLAATNLATIGDYKKALEMWDKQGGSVPELSKKDSLNFMQFKPKDAKDYIINRAKKERLVIINEAHNNANHRVFTTSLLKGLYKNGYRFLGVEALDDTLINKRKFPIMDGGSIYIQESQYANLLKEALDLGFTLFNYEYKYVKGKTAKDREMEQAQNIAKMMKENPKAKFLIHCGYDHLNEGTPGIKSWEKAMAARVTEMTGVNPFTIDQIICSERGNAAWNNSYIKLANAKTSVIMVNAKGEAFNGPASSARADCRVIHPVTLYENGRPSWLTLEGRRKVYTIKKDSITEFPVLALAYRINEFENEGIPADVIEIENKEQVANMILHKGMHRIIIKNRNYETILDYQKQIK
ncbi:hypothetical protein [uncultured Flavobacterium sp.]|uniref:hypothetical protein n=1 Tax=uncultured Flavobacterium sp. TaxID=165435 RepID=UPI0030EBA7FB|tara:strand:+ start:18543 stop:19739 length:1197 start_codon:yes stop_codon:yes gene_type:complete